MTVNDLREYWWKRKNIEKVSEALEELKALRGCQSPKLSDEPRCTSGSTDKIGELVIKIDEVEIELMKKYKEAYDELAKIEKIIAKLPQREQQLMWLRYIQFKDWPEICVEMNYGWSQTHVIHRRALKILGIEKPVHNRTKKSSKL